MAIRVACPTCSTVLNAPDTAVGKVLNCPKCVNPLLMPATVSAPAPTYQPPQPTYTPSSTIRDREADAPRRRPVRDRYDDDRDDDDYDDRPRKKKPQLKKGPLIPPGVIIGGITFFGVALIGVLLAVILFDKPETKKTVAENTPTQNIAVTTTPTPPAPAPGNQPWPAEVPHTQPPPDPVMPAPEPSQPIGGGGLPPIGGEMQWVRFDVPDGSLTAYFPDGPPDIQHKESIPIQGQQTGPPGMPFFQRPSIPRPPTRPGGPARRSFPGFPTPPRPPAFAQPPRPPGFGPGAGPQAPAQPGQELTLSIWGRDLDDRGLAVFHLQMPADPRIRAGDAVNGIYSAMEGTLIDEQQITISNRPVRVVLKRKDNMRMAIGAVEYGNNVGRLYFFMVIGDNFMSMKDPMISGFFSRLTMNGG